MSHILTFAQQKGGAGKTTALVQVAQALAAEGKRVGLLDLDPQGSLVAWGNLRGAQDMTVVQSSDWKASSDMRSLKRDHDVVLVDCPGNADILLRATIRDSDLVIAPVQPSVMDVWALTPVMEMAQKEKTPLHAFLNRVPPRGGNVEELAAMIDAPLLETRLGNRVVFSTAFMQGKTAAELQPRSKAAEEAADLAREIAALIITS
ncbi:chromosome partitioning protein [Rubricella aquisinus]|uniref:Chromosome partitioning protein n=1 Tax=Rubricella aquisinus TaxID=2028108 RepID=A0A840WMW2_9RHOB|nr:ParA family protein [Rubricella aquisinus]MBB5515921.1 chromosome partitioning protein [Rubricella aquisinus]